MAFFVMSQDLAEIPADLTFTCEGRSYGYYADPTTNCQVFHICLGDGDIKWSFLCPNQTIFNQVLQLPHILILPLKYLITTIGIFFNPLSTNTYSNTLFAIML